MTVADNFNFALFFARKRRNLNHQQLAERAGVSRATVCESETGRHRFGRGVFEKIAEALGVPTEAIMPGAAYSLINKALNASMQSADPATAALTLIESMASDPDLRERAPALCIDLADVVLRTKRTSEGAPSRGLESGTGLARRPQARNKR